MTSKRSSYSPPFRTFDEASVFARSLGLKNVAGWQDYCKSGELPKDIPSGPNGVYRDQGWAGYGDWLGTGNVANHLKEYRIFGEAREFARSLNLRSMAQWREYCKSGNKPKDIPTDPRKVYLNKGWSGFADWLGKPEVNYEELSTVPMTETVRKGIAILFSDLTPSDKHRQLRELLRPAHPSSRWAQPTSIAAKLGLPYHRVKYQLGREFLQAYNTQRRNANRLAKQPGKELEHEPLAFGLLVPEDWKVTGWESAEDREGAQEATFNREGKIIPRRIGYTDLSGEAVTSPCQVTRSLEVTKYRLEQPMTSFELWDRCTAEGFLRGELGERNYRPGAPLTIAGMDAVRHIVFDPQYMDQKWVTRTYSVYMCGASHGWSISMFCEYSGTREQVEAQHHIQRAVFFNQIAPSFRAIGR